MEEQPEGQPYERDPFLKTLSASIVEAGSAESPWVVLDRTIFYPEGGGQPSDRGWINRVPVLDVQRKDTRVLHMLDRPLAPGPARLELDWKRRFDHMQQHTGQHLLTAVASDLFGWNTTAFHLGERVCDIEVDASNLPGAQLERLEEAIAAEIRAGRQVTGRRVSAEEFATLQVRTRGLPQGHQGSIRLVEIEGIDLNTCGGTHLTSTSQLECLKILGTESMRGGSRIEYIAGGRVRRRLADHEARNGRLRNLLGTADEDLPATVSIKLDQLKESLRQIRRLEDQLSTSFGEALAGRGSRVVAAHFDSVEMAFLQKTARAAATTEDARIYLLTAFENAAPNAGFFVLSASKAANVDLRTVGSQVAELLGGRGGGTALLFQGKGQMVSNRDQARRMLEEWLDSQECA